MSTSFKPDGVWPEFTQQQQQRLRKVFLELFTALEGAKPGDRMVYLHTEPSRTTAGDLVLASGAPDWNPGSGAGLYRRSEDNASWVFIG